MTTIIAGTNRADSMTLKMAELYQRLFAARGVAVQLLSLHDTTLWERNDAYLAIEEQYLKPADRFVFIVPEYNGSYPGVLKVLFDNSDIAPCWQDKKALLTGVSTGRAGNLRGMDHLTGVLQYLQVHVYHNRLPISVVHTELDDDGNLVKDATAAAIAKQIDGFLKF